MEKDKKGLLEFMVDVQNKPELREKADGLLEKMTTEKMSHPMFCAAMLKIAIQYGYLVTGEEVEKLRSQKVGYEFSDEVKAGNGRCWPFDYSYYIDKNK